MTFLVIFRHFPVIRFFKILAYLVITFVLLEILTLSTNLKNSSNLLSVELHI